MSFTFTGISESDSPILKYLSWVIIPVGVGIIGEFFYYWFHRLQHTIPFMWRFHEVHHSLREMSSWNSNHHFTEEIFRIPFVVIPMSLLFHFETGTIPVAIGIIMGLQGQYEHSHAKLNLGFLRYVIGDNRFHRIHHSIEKHHYNKNFGSFSTVWDTVFRTAHFPKKDEWPDTGVDGVEEPKTLRQFLFMPFAAKDNAPVESPSFVPQKRKRARSQEA
jgi:sterol desaturase/sphingolipid hydroxylase (fatty acid hydroxylase superfamily)